MPSVSKVPPFQDRVSQAVIRPAKIQAQPQVLGLALHKAESDVSSDIEILERVRELPRSKTCLSQPVIGKGNSQSRRSVKAMVRGYSPVKIQRPLKVKSGLVRFQESVAGNS